METKFKVGDKIRITKNYRESKRRYKVGDIKTIVSIITDNCFVVESNDCNDYIAYITSQDPCFNVEWELVEEPRFHDAQIGDLLWNDDFGICKIKNIVEITECLFPITIRSDNGSDTITLEGKRGKNSPKATFFYYTPEDHYLTERPEPEVDWSKAAGAKVKVCDFINDKEAEQCIFAFYKPDLEYCFWVYDVDRDDIVYGYKYCSLAEPCKPEWRK